MWTTARDTKRLVEHFREANKKCKLDTEKVLEAISNSLDTYVTQELQYEKEQDDDYREWCLEVDRLTSEAPISVQM